MRNPILTRASIIEKSAVIFNTRGYSGTSIQDIMNETGLKKGGIYGHFSSKEELAAEAFRHAVQKQKAAYNEVLNSAEEPVQKLLGFLAMLKKICINPPVPGGCPILNTAPEVDDTLPAMRNEVSRAAWDWENTIAAVYRQGIEQGAFTPATNPAAEARLFVLNMQAALLLGKLHKDMVYIDQVAELLRERIASLQQ